jgi:threonine synthase
MKVSYQSTRGEFGLQTFEQVVLGGLAVDNGLFVPNAIPQFSAEKIENVRTLAVIRVSYNLMLRTIA